MEDEMQAKIKQAIALERNKGRSDEEILQLGLQAGLPREKLEQELKSSNSRIKPYLKPAIIGVLAALAVGGGVWVAQTYIISPSDTPAAGNDLIIPAEERPDKGDENPEKEAEAEPSNDDTEGSGTESAPDKVLDEDGKEKPSDTTDSETIDTEAEEKPDSIDSEKNDPADSKDDTKESATETNDSKQNTEPATNSEVDTGKTFLFQGRKEIIPLASPEDFEIVVRDARVLDYKTESGSLVLNPIKEGETAFEITHKETGQGKTYQVVVLPGSDATRTLPMKLELGKNKYLNDFSGRKTELILKNDGVIQAKEGRNGIIVITPQKTGTTTLTIIETEQNLTTVFQVEVSEKQ